MGEVDVVDVMDVVDMVNVVNVVNVTMMMGSTYFGVGMGMGDGWGQPGRELITVRGGGGSGCSPCLN